MRQHELSDKLTEVVSEELKRLEARDQDLVTKIEQLERERSELRRPIGALRTLVADAQVADDKKSIGSRSLMETDDPLEIAVNILREKNSEDMHYKALTEEVITRGGRLTNSEPWTHLNFLMNQDPRFIRPHRRGYYALKEDYPSIKRSVGERRRKRATKPDIHRGN